MLDEKFLNLGGITEFQLDYVLVFENPDHESFEYKDKAIQFKDVLFDFDKVMICHINSVLMLTQHLNLQRKNYCEWHSLMYLIDLLNHHLMHSILNVMNPTLKLVKDRNYIS